MNETAPLSEPEPLRVTRLHTLPDDLMALHEEATAQGYQFLDKLAAEWHNGTNRYDQDGQGFYGVWDGTELLASAALRQTRTTISRGWRVCGACTSLPESAGRARGVCCCKPSSHRPAIPISG